MLVVVLHWYFVNAAVGLRFNCAPYWRDNIVYWFGPSTRATLALRFCCSGTPPVLHEYSARARAAPGWHGHCSGTLLVTLLWYDNGSELTPP